MPDGPAPYELLLATLDTLEDAVCIFDGAGVITWHNHAFGALVGGDRVGQLRSTVGDWLDEPLLERHTERHVGKKWLRVTHTLHGAHTVVVAREVTQRRHTEAELIEQRGILEALVDAAPVAVLALDLDKNVIMWNPAAERMTGWTADEIIGQPYPLVPPSEREAFEGFFAEVIGGRGFTGVESTRARADGTPLRIVISTASLRDAAGNVTGAMAILDDVTEKRVLEARYADAQKMEAVGRLAGGIAHDFNNVLTIILNTCELARMTGRAAGVETEIAGIQKAAERAASLTQQLLAFSRRQVLQPRLVDLNALIEPMLGMLERLIGDDIKIVTQLDLKLGMVKVDPSKIEQLMMSLAANARDAMPRGGTLTLTTSEAETATIPGLAEGRWIELTVSDTGVGIDEEQLDHIFEPFFSPGTQPAGMGLASVYGTVQQSGGEIRVESAVGEGTTFRLLFPWAAVARPRRARRPTRGPARGTTVLVVEDDQAVRAIVREVLRGEGYRVLEADSGQAALRVARNHTGKIDAVLTDVVMEGMGGREVAEYLRIARPGIRIAFMSGYTDDDAVRRGVSRGAPFVQKPFTPHALLSTMSALLQEQGQP
jgi:PAS domain S-box-containing protein